MLTRGRERIIEKLNDLLERMICRLQDSFEADHISVSFLILRVSVSLNGKILWGVRTTKLY